MSTMIANEVALDELNQAMQALELPHDQLPEVLDKDGKAITDVKDKRLALVRQYVDSAGQILNLIAQATQVGDQICQQMLQTQHRDAFVETVKRISGGRVDLTGKLPPTGGIPGFPGAPGGMPLFKPVERKIGFDPANSR